MDFCKERRSSQSTDDEEILNLVFNKNSNKAAESLAKLKIGKNFPTPTTNIEEIYNKINGSGKFDWFIALPVGFGYSMALTYLIPLLIKIPIMQCTAINSDGNEYAWNCTRDDICSSNYRPFFSYDSTSIMTFTNWITGLNLVCISDLQLGLFGTFYCAGYVFGALTLLRFGDIYGRKRVLFIGNLFNLAIFVLLFMAKNLNFIYFLLFASGAIRMLDGSLSYIFALELIPENKRNKFSSYIMMFEATIGVLTVGSVYLWRNTFYTILMMISIAIIQQCFVFYSPESPKFLYSSNKIREMEKSFKMIAQYNGYNLKENDLDISEPSSGSTNNASQTLLQSFSDNIYKRNLIIMCFVYCVSYMNYYVIGFYVSKFNGNLFINALLLLSADLSSNLSCSYIYEKLGLKRSFMLVFIIITSATIIYSLFSNYPEITYACVFVMRFGAILATTLSMYSCSVLFETNIRARSFAFCNFTGRFLTICAPMIVTLISNPMAILTTLAICASIISQFLHSSK